MASGIELQRWKCPRCDEVFDVWLEDGKVEREMRHLHEGDFCLGDVNLKTICHGCFADGNVVQLVFDAEETAALG